MSAGGARRGRRDNGLDATEYAVAGDVDPRVGEHLLDVLAAAGIAAYLQPSSDLNPITRTTTVPARPTDRLYVDRAHLATAREFMTQLTGEDRPETSTDPDLDTEWKKIVAGYHLDPAGDSRPWPAAEDLTEDTRDNDPTSPRRPEGGTSTVTGRLPYAGDVSGISLGRRDDEPSLLDALDTFGADLPDDVEEGYTPPPPPPLPKVSKYTVVAVLAVIGGFVLFIFPDLLPIDRGIATLLGFTGVISGFITLIMRLRPGNEDDEYDPDDGARI